MSELHISEPHLSERYVPMLDFSETISEHVFIVSTIRGYGWTVDSELARKRRCATESAGVGVIIFYIGNDKKKKKCGCGPETIPPQKNEKKNRCLLTPPPHPAGEAQWKWLP